MIDTVKIRQTVNLLDLLAPEVTLKRVAGTGGGEFAGPCPFCGGADRFRVQPHHPEGGRWYCRGCGEEKWHDVIDFVMRRDKVDFYDAAQKLAGDDVPRTAAPVPTPAARPLASAPGPDWQAAATAAIGEACDYLLASGKPDAGAAWRYLTSFRGLTKETIFDAGLGFNPDWRRYGEYWLAPGIVIPLLVGGEFWSVNVRTTKAARQAAESRGRGLAKYQAMSGSVKKALYAADGLLFARYGLVCEGEFDALLASQFLPAGWAAVAAGGATMPPKRWSLYFGHLTAVYLAFDNDEEGRRGRNTWAANLPRVSELQVPEGNDVTDFWRAGGDLRAWMETAVSDPAEQRPLSALPAPESAGAYA